ncbi:MAG TPA: DUF2892 domain-containing protein [Thermodesulfobacteriota bacterium]|nr:DUF2892 domain-containing protein [Deltaproteobacteria bacterium]HNR12536.1 DUF2892 domain-containing protein [Thermodesulfobacteriota bacterium]HNU72340.1 DUF2892 domain-containing protein [Thermodesulfobacteriota bacterium]HQO78407.1 DUF2892 domain-containing protein [Thermodesulfobacteriota bacterium]
MHIARNVGKNEAILRAVLGAGLLVSMIWIEGWLKWGAGLLGAALIATALTGT